MSYRVEYGPPIPPQYAKRPAYLRVQTMTALFLLLFAILVRQFFPTGVTYLQQLLLPGVPSVTQEALDTMMEDLRNGEHLDDAFTAFCVYIVDHDKAIPH